MEDHEGCSRSFVWSSKAWFADASKYENSDEIMFGMYDSHWCTFGEMSMVWIKFGGEFVPQLKVFDDGWAALAAFGDVIKELGAKDNQNITPEQFIEILSGCGFVDRTEYESPYAPKETPRRKELTSLKQRVAKIEDRLGEQ